jgi:hypothetical protein
MQHPLKYSFPSNFDRVKTDPVGAQCSTEILIKKYPRSSRRSIICKGSLKPHQFIMNIIPAHKSPDLHTSLSLHTTMPHPTTTAHKAELQSLESDFNFLLTSISRLAKGSQKKKSNKVAYDGENVCSAAIETLRGMLDDSADLEKCSEEEWRDAVDTLREQVRGVKELLE